MQIRLNWQPLLVLAIVFAALLAKPAVAAWRYYDAAGKPHVVEYFEQIPNELRSQAINLSGDNAPSGSSSLEQVDLSLEKPPAPQHAAPIDVPGKPAEAGQAAPVAIFDFDLPRLPSASEMLALDIAMKFPGASNKLVTVHQSVGETGWTAGAVVLGLLFGVAAFYVVDRFKSSSGVFKTAVVFVGLSLVLANIIISGFAAKLDSAVSLLNTSRKLRGGTISVSSIAPGSKLPGRPTDGEGTPPVESAGGFGPGGGGGGGSSKFIAGAKPGQDPKEYFEEVKQSLLEQTQKAQEMRESQLAGMGTR